MAFGAVCFSYWNNKENQNGIEKKTKKTKLFRECNKSVFLLERHTGFWITDSLHDDVAITETVEQHDQHDQHKCQTDFKVDIWYNWTQRNYYSYLNLLSRSLTEIGTSF